VGEEREQEDRIGRGYRWWWYERVLNSYNRELEKGLRDMNKKLRNKKKILSWVLVAHTCNPSYLGGWDWEDHNLRSVQANSLWDPISKTTIAKWTEGVAQVVENLLCKHGALNLNLCPTTNKQKKILTKRNQILKQEKTTTKRKQISKKVYICCWKGVLVCTGFCLSWSLLHSCYENSFRRTGCTSWGFWSARPVFLVRRFLQ
jgi:hypothetical protein